MYLLSIINGVICQYKRIVAEQGDGKAIILIASFILWPYHLRQINIVVFYYKDQELNNEIVFHYLRYHPPGRAGR